MGFDNSDLAGVANVALRALQHQIRQTTDATPSPTESNTPAQTSSGDGSGQNNSGGSGSSPLLFFVALGFGVVFTNLW